MTRHRHYIQTKDIVLLVIGLALMIVAMFSCESESQEEKPYKPVGDYAYHALSHHSITIKRVNELQSDFNDLHEESKRLESLGWDELNEMAANLYNESLFTHSRNAHRIEAQIQTLNKQMSRNVDLQDSLLNTLKNQTNE